MTKRTSLMLTMTSVIMCSAATQADIIHVPADQPTIQDAINIAQNGDEIVVAPGIYPEVIDFLGKAIMLRSSNGPEVTTIDGTDLNDSVVKCISGEGPGTVLEGFTITGGTGDPSVNPGSTAGGGLLVVDSSPLIVASHFVENTAAGTLGFGAGAYIGQGDPLIEDCVFASNTAERGGGGIFVTSGSPQIVGCRFEQNSSTTDLGGGLWVQFSPDTSLVNCVFWGNTAVVGGGGINSQSDSILTVTNCTFVANEPHGIHKDQGRVLISNSLFWENVPEQIHNSAPTPLVVTFCDVQGGFPGEGNIDIDPLFVDLDNGDFHLSLDSPCIDVGNNSVIEEDTLDIDGEPRIGNDTVDMGADEAHDCNGNLVLDYVEIADGSIPDNNGNHIPDNCDCPADFDFDGTVDAFDLAVLLGSWGPCPEPPAECPADIFGDHDGIVQADDLAELLGSWGPCG